MELSIVTTMYYSAPYLEEFFSRCCTAAERLTSNYELIFVNDGSPDTSLAQAITLIERDPRVKVVDLSRNFGHHKAMMTGLAHAKGELVFLIDCDLEIAPEIVIDFHERLKDSDADVVFGIQETRQDPVLDRAFAKLFYILFNWLSGVKLPKNLTTARLMTRRYASALVTHQEREVLIGGLWVITGFKQEPLIVTKQAKGSSTYNLPRKIAIIVDAITSFSNRPLVLVFYLGSLISLLSGLAAMYLIIQVLFFGGILAGWPSLIVSIWLLGGLTILCLGVIGMYLSKIFTETKRRPYTIVREVFERKDAGDL